MTNEYYAIEASYGFYHHGVLGQKWGVRKYQNEDGSLTPAGKNHYDKNGKFVASNGMKVGAAKNGYVKTMRKIVANRGVENLNTATYRANIKRKHADTDKNRLETEKGVQRIKKESAALREYNAHLKDQKKGTGDKYLNKAIRNNKIANTYETIQSNSSKKDRFIYNDATRKRAAKYVIDKNMTVAEATSKAKKDAWKNTAAMLAIGGGITIASLYKAGH